MKGISLWVIYEKPLDYPEKYVVRHWINTTPTKTMYIADTLDEIRKKIPSGLVNIGRKAEDDPKIKEVWI